MPGFLSKEIPASSISTANSDVAKVLELHLLLAIAVAGALGQPPEVSRGAQVVEPTPIAERNSSGVRQRMSLDEAAAMVRDRFGGRVIRAESRAR